MTRQRETISVPKFTILLITHEFDAAPQPEILDTISITNHTGSVICSDTFLTETLL